VAWGYEQGLREALDALVESRDPLDGRVWLTKLVPFVAAMFVRGPEFQHEYPARLPRSLDKYGASDLDTATRARLIDFQVLLAPVMAARWAVVHFSKHVDLITSDRGYALTATPTGELPSYVVPADGHAALVVTPQRSGQALRWVRGRWVAELEHFTPSDTEVRALNAAVAAYARRAIYGPSKEAVDGVSWQIGTAPRLTAGLFPILDPASHLYDYFRVLTAIAHPPGQAVDRTKTVEWATVEKRAWTAPIVVEVLFPNRTAGGVSLHGERLSVDLAYGIDFRRKRRASGDFRMGALALIELERLRAGQHRIDTADPGAALADAELEAQAAAETDPTGSAAFELGEGWRARGEFDAAEIAFSWADRCGHAAAAVNLGNLRQMAGDPDGAAAAFRRAELRGNSNGTLNLGVLFQQAGDLRRAEAHLRRADQNGNPTAGVYLGQLLEARGRFKAAELAYRRSDERGSGAAALALGELLAKRNDHVAAERAFRRARDRGFEPRR
jgi:Tfp pilus assembly protein PilF